MEFITKYLWLNCQLFITLFLYRSDGKCYIAIVLRNWKKLLGIHRSNRKLRILPFLERYFHTCIQFSCFAFILVFLRPIERMMHFSRSLLTKMSGRILMGPPIDKLQLIFSLYPLDILWLANLKIKFWLESWQYIISFFIKQALY